MKNEKWKDVRYLCVFYRKLNKNNKKQTRKSEKKKNNKNRNKTRSREGNSTFIDKSELITIDTLDKTDDAEDEGKIHKSYPDKKTFKLMLSSSVLSINHNHVAMTYFSQPFDVGESSSQFSQHNSWLWKHKGEEKPLANVVRFNISPDLPLTGFLVESRRLLYGFYKLFQNQIKTNYTLL